MTRKIICGLMVSLLLLPMASLGVSALPPPLPITNLRATNITAYGAMLSWDAYTGAISYRVLDDTYTLLSTVNAPATFCTLEGLSPDTLYRFLVRAVGPGGGGISDFNLVTFRTLPLTDAPKTTVVRLYDLYGLKDGNQFRLNTGSNLMSPVIRNGKTLIPIRAASDHFGAEVDWIEATGSTNITLGDVVVNVKVGSDMMTVNGKEVKLETPTRYVVGSTFVPMRAVLEALGLYVEYDEPTGTIVVSDYAITPVILAEQVAQSNAENGTAPIVTAGDYALINNATQLGLYANSLDAAPVIGGKQYVHARKLAAVINAALEWNGATNETALVKGSDRLVIDGSNSFRNGDLYLDIAAVKAGISGWSYTTVNYIGTVGSTSIPSDIIVIYNGAAPNTMTLNILAAIGSRELAE